VLRAALDRETVPWVKRALERAIETSRVSKPPQDVTNAEAPPAVPPEVDDQQLWELKARAVEEVAGTVLHEFSAIVGALRLRAPTEVANFEGSSTSKLLEQLAGLIEAVRNLKRAAAVPLLSSFDLSELVDESLDAVNVPTSIEVSLAGERPFLVSADRQSMGIALKNGLRNAVEAVEKDSRTQPPRIVVNWGRGGVENWLVVVDSGLGFHGNPTAALGLGVTNKRDHIGYGLATAQYAMRAMGGDLLLANDLTGGARFELRWYSQNEDSLR
jgi:C4-dicarboxylate-specific signal transduction histidine kinase